MGPTENNTLTVGRKIQMQPYGVELSFRPGCACCNSKHFHHYRAKNSAFVLFAKRSAKKSERVRAKNEILAWERD